MGRTAPYFIRRKLASVCGRGLDHSSGVLERIGAEVIGLISLDNLLIVWEEKVRSSQFVPAK
ncbi:hypothetical protein NAP1_15273 [Erythrobacter sp. NAP1]|nr:hypothetical protein NAP1_15273 [Erythrobacter sp. NAP1]